MEPRPKLDSSCGLNTGGATATSGCTDVALSAQDDMLSTSGHISYTALDDKILKMGHTLSTHCNAQFMDSPRQLQFKTPVTPSQQPQQSPQQSRSPRPKLRGLDLSGLPMAGSNTNKTNSTPANSLIESEFKKNRFVVNNEEYTTSTRQAEEVYQRLEELGCGASGHVSKMIHRPSQTLCAVKQMRRSGNQEEEKRIFMDLGVLIKCHCDNIVHCYGYFIKDIEVWICMELMTTCFEKLLKQRKAPLPEKFLGAVARCTVIALNYLKSTHNIIHRDVKPSNILINERGDIKLCDFGISGRLIDSKARTRSAGCVAYMAPERLDPKYKTYDIRADVWSLGITMIELATGVCPYSNKSDFYVIDRVINGDPPTLPSDCPVSDACRNFISACLTKDVNLRPNYKKLLEHEFIFMHANTVAKLDELLGAA